MTAATTTPAPARACGAYVHVPFCRRRCPYCDFPIEVGSTPEQRSGWVGAILRELQHRHTELPWPIQTLSFGGGTPSSVPTHDLGQIVEAVRTRGLSPSAEVSLEVNPEDIDQAYAGGLRGAGFTRVSVGLQSFDDDVLGYLGRAHDGRSACAAIEALLNTGIDVAADLIVGVPGESEGRLERDIVRARALGVAHLSAYLLTLEEGTPLVRLIAAKKRAPIDDERQAAAYERVQELCDAAGYEQYEISSYARPGKSSRHNRLYWQRGDYLGVGPGAHSFRVGPHGHALRRANRPRLADWQARLGSDPDPDQIEALEPAHALREAVAFGLRDKLFGVDVAALAALHQTPVAPGVLQALQRSVAVGDVVVVEAVVGGAVGGVVDGAGRRPVRHHLTDQGVRFADRVARAVLSG